MERVADCCKCKRHTYRTVGCNRRERIKLHECPREIEGRRKRAWDGCFPANQSTWCLSSPSVQHTFRRQLRSGHALVKHEVSVEGILIHFRSTPASDSSFIQLWPGKHKRQSKHNRCGNHRRKLWQHSCWHDGVLLTSLNRSEVKCDFRQVSLVQRS